MSWFEIALVFIAVGATIIWASARRAKRLDAAINQDDEPRTAADTVQSLRDAGAL